MNTDSFENNHKPHSNLATLCLASCRKLLERIAKVKQAILEEFRDAFAVQNKMLRLALNEAEALAWETDYPHLVFPALANEKAQEVAAWNVRQRAVARNFTNLTTRKLFAPALIAKG